MSVVEAFDKSVVDASHLTARDSAAIAAARVAAARVDEGLPNDNVSMSVFLKYLEALQLLPESSKKPGPASTASDSQQELNAMRQALSLVPEVG